MLSYCFTQVYSCGVGVAGVARCCFTRVEERGAARGVGAQPLRRVPCPIRLLGFCFSCPHWGTIVPLRAAPAPGVTCVLQRVRDTPVFLGRERPGRVLGVTRFVLVSSSFRRGGGFAAQCCGRSGARWAAGTPRCFRGVSAAAPLGLLLLGPFPPLPPALQV